MTDKLIPHSKAFRDLTGQRFGRLLVLSRASDYVTPTGKHYTAWLCRCDCGVETTPKSMSLRSGASTSCGNHKVAHNRTHGLSTGDHYAVWQQMVARGTGKRHRKDYADRGIDMDPRWRDLETFIADIGPRPSLKHSLDRRDNDRGYWPDNCRWATKTEQQNNMRGNRFLEFNGHRMTVAQWSSHIGIRCEALRARLYKGWPIAQALGFEPRRCDRLEANSRTGELIGRALTAADVPAHLADMIWKLGSALGPEACWEWPGTCNESGYGMLTTLRVHRAAAALFFGAIPAGVFVLHECDNRPCCNPHHLKLGNQVDNQQDVLMRGRGRWSTHHTPSTIKS